MSSPLDYIATDTAARFHVDQSLVRHLMGPVGCGKSVACCMELFRVMCQQEKGPDGYRRTRMVCIRNTYPELITTTLKTWKGLFPTPATGRIVHGSPIVHYFELGDIRSEVIFMSLNSEDDVNKLKSLECTMVWLNEAKFLFKGAMDTALERTLGRYPAKSYSPCTQFGVIMDTNPPDDDHWLYKLFEENKLENYKMFKYPAAILKNEEGVWVENPKAENIENLNIGFDYYLNQVPGKTEDYINVMLCGKYGSSYDGLPVYPEYNDHLHYNADIVPVKGVPLTLGWDFGLTPALVIAQLLPSGQLIIIDEITTEYIGLTSFLNDIVVPHISNHYANFGIEISIGDPAGLSSSSLALNEQTTSFTILADHGFKSSPAKTNNFMPRKESISRRLCTLIDGKPAIQIGPRAKSIRKGFIGGYHFRRINVSGSGGNTKYKDEADKNQYSHPHDALQYIGLNYDNFKTKSAMNQPSKQKLMRKLGMI